MKKQVVVVSCDLCGNPVTETHVRSDPEFSVRSVVYQLDLCPRHAEDFAAAIGPFVAAGRRVSRGRRAAPVKRGPASVDLKSVREWAAAHGYPVSTRGRVPAQVLAAYSSSPDAAGLAGDETAASVPAAAPSRPARRAAKRRPAARSAASETKAIREWAKANGRHVGDRGRIPAEVVADYRASIASDGPGADSEVPVASDLPEDEDNVIALSDSPAATGRKTRRPRSRQVAAALS